MCIIFIAVAQHPDYPLIIAANRDEFYRRPTMDSHWWKKYPQVLAGLDLQAGGTWMGINKTGHIGALTNIRNPKRELPNAPSRGDLVVNYLTGTKSDTHFAKELTSQRERYNGYNLLFGHFTELKVYNNHSNTVLSLHPGFYGLSNSELNTPWPKLSRGVEAMTAYIEQSRSIHSSYLFDLLQDETTAPTEELPLTGVPLEWEKRLSSIFIRSVEYGTRSSTILLVNRQQEVSWTERVYAANNNTFTTHQYQWKIMQE